MVDIVEIYVHWYAGRSKNQVPASLGVDRKTVSKYLAPAEEAGITLGGPPHQRLRDESKLKVSLSTFRRWVHENLPDEAARSKVMVLRDDVEPGSEAQIDYGFLGQWINPATGKRHRIWTFVMVLPASRHMFVRPVAHTDQRAWTLAHAEAFRFFGGVPRRLVPDNLKTGVGKPAPYCPDCGTRARRSKSRRMTRPRDLSPGGRRPRLVWAKRCCRCDEPACRRRSPWTPRCPLISLSPHPAIVLANGTELSVPQVSAWL
ncbi:hypothetical protein ABZ642_45910 [Streptomyces sp. NPDC007157]|uniref:hypothetical protein n=1 Tax=Streptomyces sp. NPDC007157 TaxID=3154681 RepID=UPI0033F953D9